MRILQIVVPGAGEFDRKLKRVDAAALPEIYVDAGADLAHVYGPVSETPPMRYVAANVPPKRRFALRAPRAPERLIAPLPADGHVVVPEAVEEHYFADRRPPIDRERKVAGYFARPSVENLVEQTAARVARNRDDIDFLAFSATPQPEDFEACDVWLDPAIDDSDYDGFVAEAMARGVSVVAARTAINVHRSERGRTAWLVPPRDSNELTHAILAALFKPEMSEARRSAARQTISKFRPRQRAKALAALYESLTPRP